MLTAETPLAKTDQFSPAPEPIKVFVHLARDKDVLAWRAAREAGTLVGLNDETPYGYGRAEHMGCEVTFSRSKREGRAGRLMRLGLRALLGFDYLHAYRQGVALREADIVWTHTESQFLAVAAVLGDRRVRPRLLGQSVWLLDRWPSLSPLHRAIYRRLIARVDLLTFHSPLNHARALKLFPGARTALVPYGIPTERQTSPVERASAHVHVLGIGSDRHRDWDTLVAAMDADWRLTILSGTAHPRLARGKPNVQLAQARNQAELEAALAAATVVCVPLRTNLHASGITVIQEAVLSGVPVVATDTGGLSSYFGPDTVRFVPPGDPGAMRAAIAALAADPSEAKAMADRAQRRMREGDLGAEAFIRRHVELTRELLQR